MVSGVENGSGRDAIGESEEDYSHGAMGGHIVFGVD
jgi:hypothetical protein